MRPLCPKCGEPARNVILTNASVVCALNDDGTVGSVLSASLGQKEVSEYECGGKHRWSQQ
jgi:hypothetical protein